MYDSISAIDDILDFGGRPRFLDVSFESTFGSTDNLVVDDELVEFLASSLLLTVCLLSCSVFSANASSKLEEYCTWKSKKENYYDKKR